RRTDPSPLSPPPPRQNLEPLWKKGAASAHQRQPLASSKTLILPWWAKTNSCYSKLEKADILEMTVQFLKELPMSCSVDGYREGYHTCLSHFATLIPKYNLLSPEACNQLLARLQQTFKDCTWHRNDFWGCSPPVQPPTLWRPW
uniref:Hes family bHLH transcription factor 2 n=1 Tax=Laticauda laticaudata TaxID=8630 RepID=A0A8C5WST5_LATLA